MATLSRLKAGDTLWIVTSGKMGNTTVSTTNVHTVKVVSVHEDHALCSWNGNPPRRYYPHSLKSLKTSRPVTIPTWGGNGQRLATRDEKKAILAAREPKP